MISIVAVTANYPILHKSVADYASEIDTQSVQWVDIKYFFIESGNADTLEERLKELIDSYNNVKSKSNRLAHKFSEKTKGSESVLNGGRYWS